LHLLVNPDFGAVAANALPLAPAIAARLCPPPFEGKRVGVRFLWRNRTREDRELGSASLHLQTGLWADFALPDDPRARGHGLTTWVAFLYRIAPETADRWLGGMLGLCQVDPAAPPEFRLLTGEEETFAGQIASQLEAEAPAWLAADIPERRDGLDGLYLTLRQTFGPPAHVYAWRRPDGRIALLTLRWQGAEGKAVRPAIWARPADDPAAPLRWVPAWPAATPLFNADRLALRPTAPVLLCEGEKATLAAAKLFPEHVCSCVAGNLHRRADWSLLTGRDVTIWPDHDAAGLRLAETMRQRAVAAGAASVAVVALPDHLPLKWDLADPLPPGWTPEHLHRLVHAARGPGGARGPDLTILDLNRRAVPAPADVLPSWAPWLTLAAKAKSAPVDYLLAALLGTAAGLLGGRLQVEVRPGWAEPAILWLLLVGDSAANKTPALEAVEVGLEALEREFRRQYDADRLLYDTAEDKDAEEKPVLRRCRLEDTTIEAAAVVLAREQRGLLGWQPEMASWLTALTRYRQGGNDRGFWLKCYDGKPYAVDRRKLGDEPLLIPTLAVSLLGGIQPDLVPQLLQGEVDDGLAARFLLVWPSPAPVAETVIAADWSQAEAEIARALARLYAVTNAQASQHPITGREALTLVFSDNAQARFLAWREDHLAELRRRYGDAIPSFEGKAAGHVVRLAAVLHALEWSRTEHPVMPGVIAEATLAAAIELRVGFFGAHRDRAEMDAGEPPPEKLARVLARHLVETETETIDVAALRRHVRLPGLRTEARLRLALLELQAAGWLAAGTTISRQEKDGLPAVIALRSGVLNLARQVAG